MSSKIGPKEIISRCVEEFELKTQVELVVLIRKSCDSYLNFFWFYSLLVIQLFWITTLLLDESFSFEAIAIESFVLIGLCYLVLMRFDVLKFLIPKKIKDRSIRALAHREFSNLSIFETRLRSGVLIVYSHWENQCIMMCDKGIKEKVSNVEIEKFTSDFLLAFTGKDIAESLGSMIRSFGVYWHSKWPNEDDVNEIAHTFDGDLG